MIQFTLQQGQKTDDLKKRYTDMMSALSNAKTAAEEREVEARIEKHMGKVLDQFRHQSIPNVQDDGEEAVAVAKRNPSTYRLIQKRHEWRQDARLKELQDWNDAVYLTAKALNRHPSMLKMYHEQKSEFTELAKALNTATASEGGDFVPTGLSAQIIDMVELELKVANIFQTIQMPTNPYQVPQKTGRSTTYLVGEAVSDNPAVWRASQFSVGKITLDVKRFATRVNLSDDLTEDSLLPVLDILRADIANSQARALEQALINGDNSAVPIDSDITDADDVKKAWKGIRALTNSGARFNVNESGGGTLDFDDFIDCRKLGDVYLVNPGDFVYVTSLSGYYKIFKGMKDYIVTLDKYGQNAVIFNGELGNLLGSPIIVSELYRSDLNNSGVYDGTTTTRTSISLVRKDGAVIGRRGTMQIETGKLIGTGAQIMAATQRLDFQKRYASAEDPFAFMYNITS